MSAKKIIVPTAILTVIVLVVTRLQRLKQPAMMLPDRKYLRMQMALKKRPLIMTAQLIHIMKQQMVPVMYSQHLTKVMAVQ